MTSLEEGQWVAIQSALLEVRPELKAHFHFPRCRLCGRRPELMKSRGNWLRFRVSPDSTESVDIPRYEIIPCCHGSIKETEHTTRAEKLRRENAEPIHKT